MVSLIGILNFTVLLFFSFCQQILKSKGKGLELEWDTIDVCFKDRCSSIKEASVCQKPMNNWTNLLWEALPAISVFLPFRHSGCNITQLAAIAYINKKPDKMISTLIGDAYPYNSSPPRPNGRHFTGGIFKCIFLNGLKKALILIKISLKSIANGPISNIPASVHIMAWHRPGDKPLSEPMLTRFSDVYIRPSGEMS